MSTVDVSSNNLTLGGASHAPCRRPEGCLHTRSRLLTLRQQHQILDLFVTDNRVALEVTWGIYQNITWRLPCARHARGQCPDASRNHSPQLRRRPPPSLNTSRCAEHSHTEPGVSWPTSNHPRTSNKPTKAINVRIEHLHASALGFSISYPLHHSSTSLNRRIQTLPIPQIMKSQRSCRVPNPYGYHQRKIQLHRRRLRKGNAPHETTCSLSPGCAQTSGGYRSVTLCSPKPPGLRWSAGTRPGDQKS